MGSERASEMPVLDREEPVVPNSRTVAGLFIALAIMAAPHFPASAQLGAPVATAGWMLKVDPIVRARASLISGRSTVIVRADSAAALAGIRTVIQQVGGTLGRALPIINGQAADLPNSALSGLAGNSLVLRVSLDR